MLQELFILLFLSSIPLLPTVFSILLYVKARRIARIPSGGEALILRRTKRRIFLLFLLSALSHPLLEFSFVLSGNSRHFEKLLDAAIRGAELFSTGPVTPEIAFLLLCYILPVLFSAYISARLSFSLSTMENPHIMIRSGFRKLLALTLIAFSPAILLETLSRLFDSGNLQGISGQLVDAGIFLLVIFIFFTFAPLTLRLLYRIKPLESPEIRKELLELASRAGVKVTDVCLIEGRAERHANAFVSGLTPFLRHVLVTDYLLDSVPADEIRAILAHELGHIKGMHFLVYLFFSFAYYFFSYGILFLFAIYVDSNDLWGHPLTTMVQRILPMCLFVFYFVALFGFYSRRMESEADSFAIELTGSGETLKRALARLHSLGHIEETGDLLEKIASTHPTISRRIENISRGPHRAGLFMKVILPAIFILSGSISMYCFELMSNTKNLAEQHFIEGMKYLKDSKHPEAIEAFRKSLDADPHCSASRINLALSLYETGRTDEALLELQKASEQTPMRSLPLYNMGVILLRAGEYRKALDPLRQAASLHQDNGRSSFVYALALLLAGEREKAISELKNAHLEGFSLEKHRDDMLSAGLTPREIFELLRDIR